MKMDGGTNDGKEAVLERYAQRKRQFETRTLIAGSSPQITRTVLQLVSIKKKEHNGMPQYVFSAPVPMDAESQATTKDVTPVLESAARAVEKISTAVKGNRISKIAPIKRKWESTQTQVHNVKKNILREASKHPAPELTESGEELFTVEALRNHGWAVDEDDGKIKLFYQVKWLGYPESENSWSTAEQLREDLGDFLDKVVDDYRKRRRLRQDFDKKQPT